jgi:archaellum biogenesis ATPase FlaH
VSAAPIEPAAPAPRVTPAILPEAQPIAPAPARPLVTWTRFYDVFATKKIELQQSWADFVEHLRVAGPFKSKGACWLLKLARFGDLVSDKGSLRHDENVIEITGVEADYDAEVIQPEEAIERLERAGIRAAVYTSPSNTPEAPRWRVVAPLSHPHPPGARAALVARINGVLGGILAGESFTLSQSYYYGRLSTSTGYRVLLTFDSPDGGECIDELDELDDGAIGKQERQAGGVRDDMGGQAGPVSFADAQAKVDALGRLLRAGDGRRALLVSYVTSRSRRGLSETEIRVLVDAFIAAYFDPESPHDDYRIDDVIRWATERDAARSKRLAAISLDEFLAKLDGIPHASTEGGASRDLADCVVPPLDDPATDEAPHIVERLVPEGEVTLLAGHGGAGKSLLALVMGVFVALGRDLAGLRVQRRRVVFFSAEDDRDELLRRLQRVCAVLQVDRRELDGWLILLDVTELDPTLMDAQGKGPMTPTNAFRRLAAFADSRDPGLVIIDNASDTFAGEENERRHVRAFLRALRQMLARRRRAVLLLAHVNKTTASGDVPDSESYSGSTAWHNSVRSRLVLVGKGIAPRVLKHQKANRGPLADDISFDWHGGALVPGGAVEDPAGAFLRDTKARAVAERDRLDEAWILDAVARLGADGEPPNDATQGSMTTHRRLRGLDAFPASLSDKVRFDRLVDRLKRRGDLQVESRRVNSRDRRVLVVVRAPGTAGETGSVGSAGGLSGPHFPAERAAAGAWIEATAGGEK